MHRRLWIALLLASCFPASARADETPDVLDLAEGRFRVAVEWAEEPAGELWTQDLGGEGGMFGATDGGEAARLEVAEILAGKVRARYRVDERVAAFVVTHVPSGVTRRIEVSGGGVLELDPAAFAAEAAAKVTPVLDTARAVSALLGPDGGTVTATDAGGVVFTLTLPKGALPSTREITLTPLLGLGGFPFTPGFVAAVEVEPEGLRLWKAGTLKIETPAALFGDRVTFGFRPANRELFLYPAVTGSALTLPVAHLGGLGLGRGTDAEVAAQWTRVPSHPSDRFGQRLAKAFAAAGPALAAELTGCKTITNEIILKEFNTAIKKKLKTASKSCSAYRAFLKTASDFNAWASLVDPGCTALHDAYRQVTEVHKKGLAKCFNENFDKCVKKDTDAAHEVLGAYRLLKLFGSQGTVDASKIGKCVRFDLNFLSSMTITSPDGKKELLGVKASKVPLRQSAGLFTATGKGVTAWDQAKCLSPPDPPDCTCTSSPNKPGQFVAHVELQGSQLEVEVVAGGSPYDDSLSTGTSAPTFRRKIVCNGTTREDFDGNVEWFTAYWNLHLGELRPGLNGVIWLIQGLSGPNPGVFEKVYQRPGVVGDDQVQEDTSIFVSHTPQS